MKTTELKMNNVDLDACAPSACSTTHGRSERYRLISTKDVADSLVEAGFIITNAGDVTKSKNHHGKHFVRLTHSSAFEKKSEYRHDIILSSSHNGMASFKANLGVYRHVCQNELIAFDKCNRLDIFSTKYRHNNPNFTNEGIVEDCLNLYKNTKEMDSIIEEMRSIKLTEDEVREFARAATFIRVSTINERTSPDKLAKYDFGAIVQRNRVEDVEDTLWNVFNAAQENGTKGGVKLTMPKIAGGKLLRPITCPENLLFFNQHLWELAEKYRQRKATR